MAYKRRSQRAKRNGAKVKSFRTKQGLKGLSKVTKNGRRTTTELTLPYKTRTGKVRRKVVKTTYLK